MTVRTALPGSQFGRLTVIEVLPGLKRKCLCACGTTRNVVSAKLTSGRTRSCGCWSRDQFRRFITTRHQLEASNERGRFLEKVFPEPNTGCWLWGGNISPTGYGRFPLSRRGGKQQQKAAHRLLYEWEKGSIPVGRILHHTCNTPLCVNPEHLQPVTYREHILTMDAHRSVVRRQQTTCVRGHPFNDVNTYILKNGIGRRCRQCRRLHDRKRRSQKGGKTCLLS